VFIIDPATAKIIAQAAIQVVTDEETRKKVIAIALTPIIAAIMILSFAYYIMTNPIEVLGNLFSNQEHTVYAQNLQSEYGYIGGDAVIDISGDYIENEIPLFLQTDSRWKNYPYGRSGTIGSSACGPTSLAMVVVGLTGDTSVNPKMVADWSCANGYRVEGVGTAWSIFPNYAPLHNLSCEELSMSACEISSKLREGKILIASMAPGHFTNEGHFIVLRGITDSGKVLVNDPNSASRSQQEWSITTIVKEAKGVWAFGKE